LVDLSGSMAGGKMLAARATLLACLELLRDYQHRCVRWNIVAFGSTFKRLFDTSQSAANLEALAQAIDFVQQMHANMGGTNLLCPLFDICLMSSANAQHSTTAVADVDDADDANDDDDDDTDGSRPPQYSRQIFVITDGQVADEAEVIQFIRMQQSTTRIFAYGIGDGVSSTLIRALGRQGSGDSALLDGSASVSLKQLVQVRIKLSLSLCVCVCVLVSTAILSNCLYSNNYVEHWFLH
jgi:von Willebrand factor A domain-containing protein 5